MQLETLTDERFCEVVANEIERRKRIGAIVIGDEPRADGTPHNTFVATVLTENLGGELPPVMALRILASYLSLGSVAEKREIGEGASA